MYYMFYRIVYNILIWYCVYSTLYLTIRYSDDDGDYFKPDTTQFLVFPVVYLQ